MINEQELMQVLPISSNLAHKILNSTNVKLVPPELLVSRWAFYKDIFGLDDAQMAKVLERSMALLTYDCETDSPTSVRSKIDFFEKVLGFTHQDFTEMFVSFPAILSYSTVNQDALIGKINYFKNTFGYTNAELRKLLHNRPYILGYDCTSKSPTSIPAKITKYAELLNVDESVVKDLIKRVPTLLDYDCFSNSNTSVSTKITYLQQMGFDSSFIVEDPSILGANMKKIKFRYMLLSTILFDNQFTHSKWFAYDESKIYARYKYCLNNCIPYTFSTLVKGSNDILSPIDDLVKKYPITPDVVVEIEAKYHALTNKKLDNSLNKNAHSIKNNFMALDLSNDERSAVVKS